MAVVTSNRPGSWGDLVAGVVKGCDLSSDDVVVFRAVRLRATNVCRDEGRPVVRIRDTAVMPPLSSCAVLLPPRIASVELFS